MSTEHIPILQMGDLLLVTIQVEMHDQLALALQADLTAKIASTGARGVLLDISCLDIVDSFLGRMLSTIASINKVMDAETVVVGMQAPIAITLVQMGLSLPGILTALNVEKGMELLHNRLHKSGEDNRVTTSSSRNQDRRYHRS
jgi:rsbT antagonist protein RsbS